MKPEDCKTPIQSVIFGIMNQHCNEHVAESCGCSVEVVKEVRDSIIREKLRSGKYLNNLNFGVGVTNGQT